MRSALSSLTISSAECNTVDRLANGDNERISIESYDTISDLLLRQLLSVNQQLIATEFTNGLPESRLSIELIVAGSINSWSWQRR